MHSLIFYANLKRKNLFIALGHYSKEAHYQDMPIMYMESLGYIVYTGDLSDAAPYSNMNFFCDQTRTYVTNPAWVKYRKNIPAIDPADVVLPGSGSNLNFLRVQQEKGLLSPRKAKKYKCDLDNSFMVNQYPVYVLRIKRNKQVGTVQIMEVDDHYLILRFHVHSLDYCSTAWHQRVPAEVSVEFQYVDNTPFVKRIKTIQEKDGLEYRNELVSLIQKLDTFSVTSDEYWNMNTYSVNPYITFDQNVYNRYVPDGIRKQYERKRKIYSAVGIDLDKVVNAYSDRWFLSKPGEEEAIGFMKELRSRLLLWENYILGKLELPLPQGFLLPRASSTPAPPVHGIIYKKGIIIKKSCNLTELFTFKYLTMVLIYILIGLVLLIFILSSIAPKSYSVEKSIRISRPLNEVYDYVSKLRNQDQWAKWNTLDPDMKKTFQGEDGKIGFRSAWESDLRQVGAGQQTITALEENKAVYTKLEFFKPFKSESDAYIKTEAVDDSTTDVYWGFTGVMNPPMNVMLLFMDMSKLVGKDFEEGLAKLKKILESDRGLDAW